MSHKIDLQLLSSILSSRVDVRGLVIEKELALMPKKTVALLV